MCEEGAIDGVVLSSVFIGTMLSIGDGCLAVVASGIFPISVFVEPFILVATVPFNCKAFLKVRTKIRAIERFLKRSRLYLQSSGYNGLNFHLVLASSDVVVVPDIDTGIERASHSRVKGIRVESEAIVHSVEIGTQW